MNKEDYLKFKQELNSLLEKTAKADLLNEWVENPDVKVIFDYKSMIPWNGYLIANCYTPIGHCSTTIAVENDKTKKDLDEQFLRRIALRRILEGHIDYFPA